MTNHADRFFAAVTVLASDGHIKQRLIKAYQDNLDEISEDELPAQAKPAFADLRAQMHRVSPLNGEGPIRASVRKMSLEEASCCAAVVVRLFRDLLRHSGRRQEVLPLPARNTDAVPPFIVESVPDQVESVTERVESVS